MTLKVALMPTKRLLLCCDFACLSWALLVALSAFALVAPTPLKAEDRAHTTNIAVTATAQMTRESPAPRTYPPPPPAGSDLTVSRLYLQGTGGSVVDPKKAKLRREELEPLRDFSETVSRMADEFISDGDAKAAQCGLAWLRAWADSQAVLGKLKTVGSGQGDAAANNQLRFLGDVALAYLKLQPAASPQDQAIIHAWLRQLATRVQEHERGVEIKKRNNNYYKSGLALMATGIAITDQIFIAEGQSIYDFALSQIQDNGTLPREMSRQIKALIYHNAAAIPLVMMAELARRQGLDWYGRQDHRLELLVTRVVAGLKDPAFFQAKSGHKQLEVPPQHLGWLIYWEKQSKDPESVAAVLKSIGGQYNDPQYAGDAALLVKKHFFDPGPRL